MLTLYPKSWCGPCRTLSPVLEKITSDTNETGGEEVDLVTVDTDAQNELAQKYQVRRCFPVPVQLCSCPRGALRIRPSIGSSAADGNRVQRWQATRALCRRDPSDATQRGDREVVESHTTIIHVINGTCR